MAKNLINKKEQKLSKKSRLDQLNPDKTPINNRGAITGTDKVKFLIDLQRNSNATCVIIKNVDSEMLSPVTSMMADVSNEFLFGVSKPEFAEEIDEKCKKYKICYFVIKCIDEISLQQQERYVGLVKDREMNGYKLPNNCIIVFTVKDRSSLKNISYNLYHFAVVAFTE